MKLIVKVESQSFEVEVGDIHARPITATINGETFEVWPEDVQLIRPSTSIAIPVITPSAPASQAVISKPVPAASTPGLPASTGKVVRAPLPGVIIAISVQPGQVVEHGQELCIIEAMKMKNIIRASRVGTIEMVPVTLNQHVKHHDVLLEFTD